MKFMDILPPRVKIAKLYDKEYNIKSLKNNDLIKSSDNLLQTSSFRKKIKAIVN